MMKMILMMLKKKIQKSCGRRWTDTISYEKTSIWEGLVQEYMLDAIRDVENNMDSVYAVHFDGNELKIGSWRNGSSSNHWKISTRHLKQKTIYQHVCLLSHLSWYYRHVHTVYENRGNGYVMWEITDKRSQQNFKCVWWNVIMTN